MKKGWEIKKLGEICDLSAGGDVPKNDYSKTKNQKHNIPIYANGEKNNGLYGYTSIPKITKPSITVSARGTIGFTIKRLENFYPVVRLIVVTPKDLNKLDLSYLYYAFKTIDFIHSGTSIPQLTVPMIRDYKIPLPPLSEQQRIVSILDRAFAAIDHAKANAEKNLQNTKELLESYITNLFDSDEWPVKSLEEICENIFAGGDAPKEYFSKERTHEFQIPIYANAVKNQGLYGFTNEARVNKPAVSIAARGSGTGQTELRKEPFLPIVRLIVCVPDTDKMGIEFLKYSIDNLVIARSGSAIPQLTVPMIKTYSIPVPPIDIQESILSKLKILSLETQKLETIYQKKIDALEELKKSILQKAMAGELVESEIEKAVEIE